MPGEIFDFIWFVSSAGYTLVDAGLAGGQSGGVGDNEKNGNHGEGVAQGRLIAAKPSESPGSYDMEQYNPLLEQKCLFRAFAETGMEPEDIIGFADEYGLMGFGRETAHAGSSPVYLRMEPLESWRDEIRAMRKALRIWDMVQDEDGRGLDAFLSPLMRWVEADMAAGEISANGVASRLLPNVDPGELRWYRSHPESLNMYRAGNLAGTALLAVQAIANQHLERRISPRILWDDRHLNGWSLYFVPNNLIGALWLQLSQSITQEKDYRRCRQCDTWFEIDHYTARTNRYFCSNACRSKAYRDRQARARELRDKGMDYDEIAGQLGSDMETVRGWIGKAAAGRQD